MRGNERGAVSTAAATFVGAMLVTALVAWAAWAAYDDNEDRLTLRRTREAGAVLAAAVPTIEIPLTAAAALAVPDGDAGAFQRAAGSQVGPDRRFVSMSAWEPGADRPSVVIGEQPELLSLGPAEVRSALADVDGDAAFHVVPLLDGDAPRLGYVARRPADQRGASTVYAEQLLPPDRTSVVQPDSAFSGLDYALYLGTEARDDLLVIASTAELPLDGRTATEPIPFGSTTLLLVMAPTEQLAGGLLAALPWLVLATGAVVATAAAALVGGLTNGRRRAEALAAENARLYEQQRDVAHTLQQSLLPQRLPHLDGVDIAVRYIAGVAGTEVGGDWYDVLLLDGRLVVVVGDVSGRGVGAAAVMAALRYSIRTLAEQGGSVGAVLDELNGLRTIDRNGHFATVLASAIDPGGGTATFANAGHPPPLLLTDGDGRFLDTPVGPPIGVTGNGRYAELPVALPPDGMLLLVSDGLFERRSEPIDEGLERLRAAAASAGLRPTPDALLDQLVDALTDGDTTDDAVLVAIRWRS